jgi:hypothetical protein
VSARLGIDVVGGLPGHEFLPGGPGKHALDRDHLGRLEPGRDISAEGGGEGLLVIAGVAAGIGAGAWAAAAAAAVVAVAVGCHAAYSSAGFR